VHTILQKSGRLIVLVVFFERLDARTGFVLGHAIRFLNLAGQLIELAGNHVEVIVGQFSPLFFRLAFELLPVSLHDIPVHFNLLIVAAVKTNKTSSSGQRGLYGTAYKGGVAGPINYRLLGRRSARASAISWS
jgi:hypothetical protein